MGRASSFQNEQTVIFSCETVSTAATSATLVDTLGHKTATLYVIMNKSTNASSAAKWTSLVIQHGLSTAVSDFTAIDGLTGTTESTATTNEFIIQTHSDNTNAAQHIFDLDLGVLERYIRVVKKAPPSHFTTCNMIRFPKRAIVDTSEASRGPANGTTTIYKKMADSAAKPFSSTK